MLDGYAFRRVGVLGGMGPLATIDFMKKIISQTPAEQDQEHIPMIVYCIPQIPDRTLALQKGGADPMPALITGIATLEQAGAEVIAIPCNTAHAWYDQLVSYTDLPILHIADAVRRRISNLNGSISKLAIMAAPATARLGFYQERLGYAFVEPEEEFQNLIWTAISFVKAGQIEKGRYCAELVVDRLLAAGAQKVLLACTELPIALADSCYFEHCIDPTECLAVECVSFSLSHNIL